MITLSDEFQETHTWFYWLIVDPFVQVEVDQCDNWTVELLQEGFGWWQNYPQKDLMLDVTFVEREDRCQLQAFLDQHGLRHRVYRLLRGQEEDGAL
ncbi:hypothetical protein [Dictyobacter formicarum]|uniref:Uncharacterized protein n=1 Tax=Dictyobacter formicarum TaxID=2778368 RepID=A0ABQ3VQV1_9CHLR|nr:hypothetical protein [Dictyobacter formicarum]GHO88198.1 hypothetical protein KSZ_62040 [Dictyobacter formicarum]